MAGLAIVLLIILYSSWIDIKRHISSLYLLECQVNGIAASPTYSQQGFEIIMKGRYIRVQTNFGLMVDFDGKTIVVVCVPEAYQEKVEGICADFDGNLHNDFVTKEGVDVSGDPDKYTKVGNSWQVDDPAESEWV